MCTSTHSELTVLPGWITTNVIGGPINIHALGRSDRSAARAV